MAKLLDALDLGRDIGSFSNDEMNELAFEIRELLVDTIHANGDAGHLASNLGAVEISLALHRVYDTPYDKIIFDVGHQAYIHKLLTGRRDRISTLRQQGGLSGFPDRRESEHDAFGVGHAGTALSAATGYALARDLRGEENGIVAVVGDGALTAGLSFEALNHLGSLGSDVVVVLNDNEMSISPNVGAINRSINRFRVNTGYRDFKNELKKVVTHIPTGKWWWDEWRRLKKVPRDFIVQSGFWDQLGFDYYGPIDGHDIAQVESTLRSVRHFTGKPALIHASTEKGHGVPEAAADPVKSHSGTYWLKPVVDPEFRPPRTYSQVFGDAAASVMREDERVVVITPAMIEGSGLTALQQEFPRRVQDVGIAEQHAVTVGAGLAAAGMKPIVAIYSTFLQRGFDSVVHDVAVQGLPVVFAVDRAGHVGEDGRTHQGFADISFLRCLPDMVVAAPADDAELVDLLDTALMHDGPFAIRYPRGTAPTELSTRGEPIEIGTGTTLREGTDLALIGIGAVLPECLVASDLLAVDGHSAAVINARFAKPLDEELILDAARRTGAVVTIEENVRAGGFGEAVLALLAEHGLADSYLGAIAMPDANVEHASQSQQRIDAGLDSAGIVRTVRALLGRRSNAPATVTRIVTG